MRYFYCENIENEVIALDREESRHLFTVLRAKKGTMVMLLDGRGGVAEGVVREDKSINILKRITFKEPEKKIHLFVAVPRKQKLDILLSQCTEAGVWSINPVITERCVALPKKQNVSERWKEKVIEACKQSSNPFFPDIAAPMSFSYAIERVKQKRMTAFYGDTEEKVQGQNVAVHQNSDLAWFVGPEGGFTESETQIMKQSGFKPLSLGNWIMRVETAALAGVVVLQR